MQIFPYFSQIKISEIHRADCVQEVLKDFDLVFPMQRIEFLATNTQIIDLEWVTKDLATLKKTWIKESEDWLVRCQIPEDQILDAKSILENVWKEQISPRMRECWEIYHVQGIQNKGRDFNIYTNPKHKRYWDLCRRDTEHMKMYANHVLTGSYKESSNNVADLYCRSLISHDKKGIDLFKKLTEEEGE